MKNKILSAGCLAMMTTGCFTPAEKKRFQLEATNQICAVDSLAKEKQTTLTASNNLRYSIAPYQNKHGDYSEDTNTILMQKLNSYEAELEASYRFVTQSCGAYVRCLERNDYDERLCRQAQRGWDRSQERFNQVSVDIKEIMAEVEIELARIEARKSRKRHSKRGRKRHHQQSYGHKDCCGTINNIFTDCCER